MASFESSLRGIFSSNCDGKFDIMGSYCIQGMIIDATNVLFLCTFFISLLIFCLRQRYWYHHTRRATYNEERDSLFTAVSVCCGLTAVAHLVSGFAKQRLFWLVLERALIWASFSVSLLFQRSKWLKILSSLWWVLSFSLASTLSVEKMSTRTSLDAIEVSQWVVSSLLLLCACKNIKQTVSSEPRQPETTTEPLLGKTSGHHGRPDLVGKLTFSWVNPLLRSGHSKPLTGEDVPRLAPEDEAEVAFERFSRAWDGSVLRSIARLHWRENVAIGALALTRTLCVVASPLILYAFVNYAKDEEEEEEESRGLERGLSILCSLAVAKSVESLSQRHWFFRARRCGMRIRSALMAAVYEKQLRLSSSGRRRHSAGEITSYVAVDAYRTGECLWWLHLAWTSGAQLILAVVVLLAVVGGGALAGLVPLAACAAMNVPFARALQRCQRECAAAQDRRLRSTAEALNGMRVIKAMSWEGRFEEVVGAGRALEFRWLAEAQMRKAFGTFLYWMSPTVVSSVVFMGCALLGTAPLDAATIFTVLATLRSLGDPVRMIPEALSAIVQVKVSLDRLESFLLDDDLGGLGTVRTAGTSVRVRVRGGSFGWDLEADPALRRIDLEVGLGEKIAVCGPVGAGKSSLLYAILGEIPKLSGSVEVCGSVAYVSQTSWIQSGTVRDNILYGKAMENDRYEKAIEACALDKDISSFDHGDLTEIGQRGINLSGGQKQRIQLARAVYSDADVYLLDDPFSAVDAQTAAILFNECVMTALRNKTVILVTHQVEFLSGVDKILVMEGGEITQSGSYSELLKAGTAFEQLVNAHRDSVATLGPSNSEAREESRTRTGSSKKNNGREEISAKVVIPGSQLTREEEKEIGDLGWKPFRDYISVSKGSMFLWLSVLSQVCFVLCQACSTYWLAIAIQFPEITSGVLVGIYTAIASLSAIFVYLRSFFTARLGLKASEAFFSAFTSSIFRAPMSFFDSTPIGRILTRASSDMSILDYDIPFSISYVVAPAVELVAIIIIVASVTWQVLIAAIFSMVASKYLQGYYLATARELVRINGTTKAPVTNYVSETSLGVVTIRAFRSADRFFKSYLKLVDTDAALFFFSNASLEWLLLRVEALQNLNLFTTAFFLVLLPKSRVTPGLVGLSLSYALSLTGTQIFLTRWYCNLSNHIVSVERIKQFMHIPPEPPAIVETNRPPPSWPTKGRIELHSLEIKYRPNSPLVLKGITCTFGEGTRVGVVGRTGSGKTTLISALFRLVEPTSGKIIVDGLDICSIGLKDLRLNLSIIPQEPTLFRGSIRTNLDPLGLYSDQEIWNALEKCQLKATVARLPNLLDSSVSEEGENWSAGERQLFCLGRVLLKRNRILVLDEATASIDSATDATLQRIIREEFSGCTVITVAHRVPTVIDSDMVMVLSYGELVEYDEPSKLIDANSFFSKLVAEYWSSCKRNS